MRTVPTIRLFPFYPRDAVLAGRTVTGETVFYSYRTAEPDLRGGANWAVAQGPPQKNSKKYYLRKHKNTFWKLIIWNLKNHSSYSDLYILHSILVNTDILTG